MTTHRLLTKDAWRQLVRRAALVVAALLALIVTVAGFAGLCLLAPRLGLSSPS